MLHSGKNYKHDFASVGAVLVYLWYSSYTVSIATCQAHNSGCGPRNKQVEYNPTLYIYFNIIQREKKQIKTRNEYKG
jgi:hypothetical protein